MKQKIPKTNSFRKMLGRGSYLIWMLLFCAHFATATPGSKQEVLRQRISVAVENSPLGTVLSELEQRTKARFVYNPARVDLLTKVTIKADNLSLADVLEQLGASLHLSFEAVGRQIIIEQVPQTAAKMFANEVLKGTVKDEKGEALPGVNVLVKGTQNGTISNLDGQFELNYPGAGSVLVFSFVGYTSQEVIVQSASNLSVVLAVDNKVLSEVVVVGYGVQKKSDITGSVSSVGSERLETVPNLNVAQAIQGAVAGVMIQQSSGGAASSESMMVRGRNSILASNDPLIILDGIPYGGRISDINVNDVKSIEVLKDASAAAIYGSRGSNGVILITTKMGATEKPVIAYDVRYSVQKPTALPKMMNAEEYYAFKQERFPGSVTASEQAIYDAREWVDYTKLAIRDGASTQHNLSVSGGNERTKYFVGGNYLGVKGLAVNDGYKRITTRINLDTKIADWLTLGTRTQLSYDDRSGYPLNWNLIYRKNPLTRPYDANGNLNPYPWAEYNDIASPLDPLQYDYTNEGYQVVTNNYLQVDVPFVKGLSYRLNTGIRRSFYDQVTYMGRDSRIGLEARGVAESISTRQNNTVLENVLSYTRDFGKHHVFVTGLYSYENNRNKVGSLYGRGFPHDFVKEYAIAQAEYVLPGNNYLNTDLISQMLRVNYAYDGRYLLTLTGRRDGYSGFGTSSKWGTFPSVALGWNIARESFFPENKVVDDLKLRFSIGRNGNQAVAAYESISRLSELNFVSGNAALPGYIPSKLGQDDLGWESTKTVNGGLDFSLWNGRITGDLNVFRTNTFDLLLNRTISSVHGISEITQNIGKTQNSGVELSFFSRNLQVGDFKWTSRGNLSNVRNKIVSLYGQIGADGKELDDVANSWFIGKPILVNFGYVWNGVWQLNEAEEAAKWGTGAGYSRPGFLKVKDSNGDGVLNADDREIIGQKDPKFLWGLSNSFSYRRLSMEVFVHGVHGVTKVDEQMNDASTGNEARRNVTSKNRWTPQNPTNDWFMNHELSGQMAGIGADYFSNASFVRIKDISLSYDLTGLTGERLKVSRLRVFATGRNLFTFSPWTGVDPELNFGRGAVPLQKEYVFGASIAF
jgi:TonB-linked SusC/RagA family outer membrane protein